MKEMLADPEKFAAAAAAAAPAAAAVEEKKEEAKKVRIILHLLKWDCVVIKFRAHLC